MLGLYATDNRFTAEETRNRTLYIRKNLYVKKGIKVLCSGSDGDPRFLKAQKSLINFGNFMLFGSILLAGNIDAENMASQDSYHIVKKMKNVFYDSCNVLRMGKRFAVLGHLIILVKKFPKNLHNLTSSDLDPTDKMNYQ